MLNKKKTRKKKNNSLMIHCNAEKIPIAWESIEIRMNVSLLGKIIIR